MKNTPRAIFLISFLIFFGCRQISNDSSLKQINLDIELVKDNIPLNWKNSGDSSVIITVDTLNKQQGKYSILIENIDSIRKFKEIALDLPANYKGKEIVLKGYIKSEISNDGFGSLSIKLEPNNIYKSLDSYNLIKGKRDWQEYSIKLPLNPERTEKIIIGGYLFGSGKLWFDNFQVLIDGKPLNHKDIQVVVPNIDKEFDNSSKLDFISIDENKVRNLELLGRIWGFLKYHHPKVSSGDYNWDYELFRILPAYLNASDNKNRDILLIHWIDKLGTIPTCKTCQESAKKAFLKADHSWLNNYNLSNDLKNRLIEIYKNRNQLDNYYVKFHPKIGNPEFTNENAYPEMPYPDPGFRLLSLFRYWNMIEYFFPYKYLTDKNWNEILKLYIPIFLNAKNELEYEFAVIRIIGEINDTHGNIYSGNDKIQEIRGDKSLPFIARFIENKLVVVEFPNPALKKSGKLKIGDIITHIDGKEIRAIIDSISDFYPASNEAVKLRDISRDLLRSSKDNLNLKVITSNQNKSVTVPLFSYEKLGWNNSMKTRKEKKSYKLLADNIGYITLESIKTYEIREIMNTFKNTKAIIIDIRNYPNEFVPYILGSYLVEAPAIFAKVSIANSKNPGEFILRNGTIISPTFPVYNGKIIVLINEYSQSQSEFTTMALQAGKNTTVIGSTTAGADGEVSYLRLPGNISTAFSGMGIYYPNGKETQRIGIIPDINVKPTILGIRQGKDEILEKAISIINK